MDELKQKFDEQVKVNEALALELVNTQKVVKIFRYYILFKSKT